MLFCFLIAVCYFVALLIVLLATIINCQLFYLFAFFLFSTLAVYLALTLDIAALPSSHRVIVYSRGAIFPNISATWMIAIIKEAKKQKKRAARVVLSPSSRQ